MTTTAAAIYENGVLRPLSPLPLAEGTRVEVTVRHEAASLAPKAGRTGAELARIWPTLSHLSEEESAAFERDLAVVRAAEGGQPAPAWE